MEIESYIDKYNVLFISLACLRIMTCNNDNAMKV